MNDKPTAEQLKERRKAWVEALRSGKYNQTNGALARIDGDETKYCCLGVGCEVANQMGLNLSKLVTTNKVYYGPDRISGAMPDDAVEFFGMKINNGGFHGRAPLPSPLNEQGCLAELNDHGASFSQIADFIESNPPGLWTDDAEAK